MFLKKLICLSFALLFSLLSIAQPKTSQATIKKANAFVTHLYRQNTNEAMRYIEPSLSDKMNADVLKQIATQLKQLGGDFLYIDTSISQSATANQSVKVASVLEKSIITLQVNFNSEEKVIGFFIASNKAKSQEENTVKSKFREQELRIPVQGGTLSGSMMYPENHSSKLQLAIFVAGSGPTDRNCNSVLGLTTNAFLQMAEALAQNNIASFRYDKRWVGESNNFELQDNQEIHFTDFVQDLNTLIDSLKNTNQFSEIFLVGHSEGALISALAAQKTKRINGYISLAGMGIPIDKILVRQLSAQGFSKSILEKTFQAVKLNQPNSPAIDSTISSLLNLNANFTFLHELMQYNPAAIYAQLKIPMLIVGGGKDVQVLRENFDILVKANPKAAKLWIDNLDHVLKENLDASKNSYNDPSIPISGKLVSSLVQFMLKR